MIRVVACCAFCGKDVEEWELHELGPDDWYPICIPCVEVSELNYGK